ncbi:putative O-glycosylation ligase, exosortase A system-associated [Lichenicola sp.]|uniref:putative O-glycosylation ligase, exosortase A system-associated n=1 Tax=Lichenicola sp. TaxID=2804529 RepID=UPI003AFFA397
MRDIAFLACWLVLLPLVFRGAHLGVLLWAWTSLLAPNDLLYGIGMSIPFAKLAALPTLLQLVFHRRGEVQFRIGRTGMLMLALGVLAVVSQSLSPMVDTAPGWDLCVRFLKVLGLALAVLCCINNRLRVHGLLLAICLGIGYIAVDEGAKFLISGSSHKVVGSPSLGDNNQVALDVVLMLPLLHYLYGAAASRLLRLVCIGTAILAVVTVIATFSRGGFIGLMIVAIASVAGSRRKVLAAALLAVSLAVGWSLTGADWAARIDTVQHAQNDDSFMGRVEAWKVSLSLALERPLTGGGLHAIQHADMWNSQARRAAMLQVVPGVPIGVFPRAAHSIYFEVLGDLGVPGLVVLLLLLAGAWRDGGMARRLVSRSGRADLIWAAALAGHLRVSLLAFMVSGGLLSAAYRDIDYLLVALLAVVRMIVQRSLATPDAASPNAADPDAAWPRGRVRYAPVRGQVTAVTTAVR